MRNKQIINRQKIRCFERFPGFGGGGFLLLRQPFCDSKLKIGY
jgi:hypothetical protein